MELFDAHCHLDDERFDIDRAQAVARMKAAGISRCVCVGSDLPSSQRCANLTRAFPGVYAAAGVHPHEAKDAPGDYIDRLRALLALPGVVALGEIGLDYYYDHSPRDTQRRVLREQLDLACALDVPVILHIRDAHGEMYDVLRARAGGLPACVIHCCSASAEMTRAYVKLGCYISFAGPVTYKNAAGVREASLAVPLDRLLIETDSPYLAPVPLRGRRNEPAFVRHVLDKQAELHGVSTEALAAVTTDNALRFYRIA